MHGVIEMQVRVDESRHDQAAPAIHDLFGIDRALELRAFAYGDNLRALKRDRPIAKNAPLAVDRTHGAAGKHGICLYRHLPKILSPITRSSPQKRDGGPSS